MPYQLGPSQPCGDSYSMEVLGGVYSEGGRAAYFISRTGARRGYVALWRAQLCDAAGELHAAGLLMRRGVGGRWATLVDGVPLQRARRAVRDHFATTWALLVPPAELAVVPAAGAPGCWDLLVAGAVAASAEPYAVACGLAAELRRPGSSPGLAARAAEIARRSAATPPKRPDRRAAWQPPPQAPRGASGACGAAGRRIVAQGAK